MIRYSPENNKPGNTMTVEKAKGRIEATPEEVMPETIMPVGTKPSKIIKLQGQRMKRRKCFPQGTGRQGPRYRNITMKLIRQLKDSRHTGTRWENAWEKDTCQNGMRGTVWIECIYLK
jgi:hypothetical protein